MLLFGSSTAIPTGPLIRGGRFFVALLSCLALLSACSSGDDGGNRVRRPAAAATNAGHRAAPGPAEAKLIAELEAADITPCRAMLPAQVTSDMVATVRVAVDAMGVVQNARILTSTYPHKRFEACLLRVVKAVHPDPPGRTLSVDAGFILKQ